MSTHDTDVIELLAGIRPDVADLEQHWSAADRTEIVDRILRGDVDADARHHFLPARRATRRRRVMIGSALVAATVVAIAVPTFLPEGSPGGASPAAAAALQDLAHVAAATPADTVGPGQFVHTVVRNHQVGVFVDSDPGDRTRDLDDRYESWTGASGDVWRRDVSVAKDASGAVLHRGEDSLHFPADSGEAGGFGSPLPTEPDALQSYLYDHVHGSSSIDEAVFLALGDVLRSTTAPPAQRSAALTVLARIQHVTLGSATADSLGRRVQELRFSDQAARPGVVQTFYIDPRTAQLVEERTVQPQLVNTTTMLTSEVVASVPAPVSDAAVLQD